MKSFIKFCTFALILSYSIMACSNDDKDNPSSPDETISPFGGGTITLNGDGYSNKTFTFFTAMGAYVDEYECSSCGLFAVGEKDSIFIAVTFKGNSTGTYKWSTLTEIDSTSSENEVYFNGVVLTKVGSLSNTYYTPTDMGETVITEYGAIGGKIAGNFEGTIINPLTNNTITVKGNFKAMRVSVDDM